MVVGLWCSEECKNGCVNDGVCDVHYGVCLGDVVCCGVSDGVFDVVFDGVSGE